MPATRAIEIRAAQPSDLSTLLEFEQGVIAAERPHASDLKETEISYYDLEGIISSRQSKLLVAEVDAELIGSGFVRIECSKAYHKSEQHGYLGFMYVAANWRGNGVNKCILDELINWGQARGIVDYKLDVYAGNQAAIRAYEKRGFAANLLEMTLESSS